MPVSARASAAPQAVVRSVTEGQRRWTWAASVELVGVVERGGLTVGGGKHDEGLVASVDGVVTEAMVVGGGPHGELRGAVEAE